MVSDYQGKNCHPPNMHQLHQIKYGKLLLFS